MMLLVTDELAAQISLEGKSRGSLSPKKTAFCQFHNILNAIYGKYNQIPSKQPLDVPENSGRFEGMVA